MQDNTLPNYEEARRNMVKNQLRPNQVTDRRILVAMGDIPREIFVPFTLVGTAYSDSDIQLIAGRAMMPPLAFARLLQAAEIGPHDRVLELAPATGYSTMVLTKLSDSVASVEPDALLHKEAEKNISSLAPGKATILAGAPVEGCIARAPFDVIFINGSVEYVPDYLFEQLAEGGRLVAVLRNALPDHIGHANLYRKIKGEIVCSPLFEINVPPAPGFALPQRFKL
ncbi:MAG: protein-L-isoaspartate O-methyltransferase [Alphaproteobacteria bacterium]|nr:protein-L-isoaspartate O-methyltransferase [Alphaproteobacteria bacterium]